MLKSLLNILLIILLFLSTLGYVGNQLTKPDFLVTQAKNVHLYQQATGQIGTLLPKDTLKNWPLSSDDIQTILTKAIDAETFYTDLGQAGGAYLNYLTGRSSGLHYSLNLIPIKTKITDQATAVLVADYEALPTCKASELKSWSASTAFPSCQLPSGNVQTNDVNTLLGNQVSQTVDQLPDQWTAAAPSQSLVDARNRVMQILHLIQISWLTTLGVVVLYMVVGRRRAFLSLAMIFLLAGLLEIGFSLIAWDWVKRLLVDAVSSGQSQQLITLIGAVVDDAVQTLKTILGNLSIVTLSIGGGFLILWAFTRFGRAKKPEEIDRR